MSVIAPPDRFGQEPLASIKSEIVTGIAKLRETHAQIVSARQHRRGQVEQVCKAYLQAKANDDAVASWIYFCSQPTTTSFSSLTRQRKRSLPA